MKIAFEYTTQKGDSTALTKKAIECGYTYIIAVGGDGTLNEVVNGFMLCSETLRKKIIIGLLPKGTGNDFARNIKNPTSLHQIAYNIANKINSRIDVGEISFFSEEKKAQKRYFINIADAGIGAQTVEIVDNSSKKLGSNLTFILSVLKSFAGYKHKKVKVWTSNFEYTGKIVSVCFANGKWFGSGLGIAPHAKLNDGKIALVIVGNIKMRTFLSKLFAIKKTKFVNHKKLIYKTVDTCNIESLNEKCGLESDGEFLGFLPAQIKMHKQALNFLGKFNS